MIFSGINSREIARKNEVSFKVNVRPSNAYGKAEIGFSGVGGIPVRFHLESGFVYDRPIPSQVGDFVTAYSSLESFEISGNISGSGSSSLYNYEVDGQLVSLTGLGPGTGISKFFVNTTGLDLDVSIVIASDVVSGSVSFPDYFRERQDYTGYLSNNDAEAEITIYSGFVRSPTGMQNFVDFSLKSHADRISPGASGALVINPSGGRMNNLYDVDLVLYTNYGQVSKQFRTSGQSSGEYYSNLLVYPVDDMDFIDIDTSGVSTGYAENITKTGYYTALYTNYLNQDLYTGANFQASLTYISGATGDMFTGDNGVGTLGYGGGYVGGDILSGSGYLEGSGYVTSGTVKVDYLSGTDTLNGSITSGLGITGYANSTGNFLFYATGEGSLYHDMIGTGYATLSGDGGLSGTRVITTGSVVGTLSGTGIGGVHPYTGSYGIESGHRLFSGQVTGLPVDVKSLDYVSSGLQSVSGHSGILVDYIVASGIMTGDSGAMVSGLGDYSGYLTGQSKSFTGVWDIVTGYLTDGYVTGAVSYRSGEHYSGNAGLGYAKEIDKAPMGDTQYNIFITQDTLFDQEPMVVSLGLSGVDETYYETLITGQR